MNQPEIWSCFFLLHSFLFSLKLMICILFACWLSFFLCIDWSIAFLFRLSENGEISSRCVQDTPIVCLCYWFRCDLWTSLYYSSRNFLPLVVVSPSYVFLFWGFLPWWAQCLSDGEQGALQPPAWVHILTDRWTCDPGQWRQVWSTGKYPYHLVVSF